MSPCAAERRHESPNRAQEPVTVDDPGALEGVGSTTDTLRRPFLAAAVAAIVVVFTLGGAAAPTGAQEPTGDDQIVCPPQPVQAAGRDFSILPLEGPTSSIDLRCADLQRAVFTGIDLGQADLRGANLTGATFDGAVLVQTKLQGAVLRDTTIRDSDMTQAELAGADLRGIRVRNTEMQQVELPGADLVGAELVDVDLGQANLTGARLVGVDATDARFSQTRLVGADLTEAILAEAVLTQTELGDATLDRAVLRDATAPQASLERASLRSADLTGASFAQADLTGADLTGAIVTGADFTSADLTGADVDEVIGATEPFPRMAWVALGLGGVVVVLSVVGLVLRLVRRNLEPPNPYDTPLTAGNTVASFVLVPAMACVQAVGIYLLVCSITGVVNSGLNPLGSQQEPPFIGSLAFRPSTIVVGFTLVLGGGIMRSIVRRI